MSSALHVRAPTVEPPHSPSERLRDWLVGRRPQRASDVFCQLVDGGLVDLPFPGEGETFERWRFLQVLGGFDLAVARLVEGHADALAILHEAGLEPPKGPARLGVWAAGPLAGVNATRLADEWRLSGVRRWCSGAAVLTHALVTAAVGDLPMLFLVELDRTGITTIDEVWQAVGMAESETGDVAFSDVIVDADSPVGGANFYLGRRGFWLGAIGVAAVWLGGATGVARALEATTPESSAHQLAHLGAIWSRLSWMQQGLVDLAEQIDHQGLSGQALELRARSCRIEIEAGASEVLARTGRATGAGPLGHDRSHARLAADLPVYLRQSHAELDLEALGRLVVSDRRADAD